MEVIGALKKSKSQTTIFFCLYSEDVFNWDDVVSLLMQCNVQQDLEEENISCVAVESSDNLKTDKRLVGVVFKCNNGFISLTPQEYTDLDFYLRDIADDNNE